MRAAYGEAIRKFFVTDINPLLLIDFAGFKVFDSATVDTNILIAKTTAYQNKVNTCVLGKGFSLNNMSDYFRQHTTITNSFSAENSWVVLSSIEQGIKAKIENAGIPLKDWDINIYRGILTGYNEAFIIDTPTKDELIAASPKSAEIIRPILLGRNIKRYGYDWENLYIINSHNGIREKNIPPIDVVKNYPVIFKYLSLFEEQLTKRLDKGIHWTNLRNCAYLEDFDKPKIAWGNLALRSQFSFISNDFIINAPSPFFATDNLYLLAILNSKVGDYYIKQLGVARSGGYIEYKPMFVEQLPIPRLNDEEQEPFIKLVKAIIKNKLVGEELIKIENKINEMVFSLYKLNSKEILTVGNQLSKIIKSQ